MVGCNLYLVLALAVGASFAQEGVSYLRSGSFEIDSDEHGQFKGPRDTNCTCGVTNKMRGRIVNGVQAQVNEYPHMVVVGRMTDDGPATFCGGTILNQNFILTAAHCTEDEVHTKLCIIAGEHSLDSAVESKFTKLYMVDEVIDHDLYDTDKVHYDISLLVVRRRPIQFNMGVGPICLPSTPLNLVGQYVKVTGWGALAYKGASSMVLMKVNLKVVPLEMCATHHGDHINHKYKHQFCTYSMNRDSCQGDSGGPVTWLDPETNRYTLAGVVSFGKGCAGPSPGVNTDVSKFIDWIHHKIHASQIKNRGLSTDTCSKI